MAFGGERGGKGPQTGDGVQPPSPAVDWNSGQQSIVEALLSAEAGLDSPHQTGPASSPDGASSWRGHGRRPSDAQSLDAKGAHASRRQRSSLPDDRTPAGPAQERARRCSAEPRTDSRTFLLPVQPRLATPATRPERRKERARRGAVAIEFALVTCAADAATPADTDDETAAAAAAAAAAARVVLPPAPAARSEEPADPRAHGAATAAVFRLPPQPRAAPPESAARAARAAALAPPRSPPSRHAVGAGGAERGAVAGLPAQATFSLAIRTGRASPRARGEPDDSARGRTRSAVGLPRKGGGGGGAALGALYATATSVYTYAAPAGGVLRRSPPGRARAGFRGGVGSVSPDRRLQAPQGISVLSVRRGAGVAAVLDALSPPAERAPTGADSAGSDRAGRAWSRSPAGGGALPGHFARFFGD
jgi:hypothetical protein